MQNSKTSILLAFFLGIWSQSLAQMPDSTQSVSAQTPDSTQCKTLFTGSFSVTNNGFSIIPTFSLNSPTLISTMSWRTGQLSISPDIRLTPDAKKGGILLWLRYQLIEQKKWSLRVGIHPALAFLEKEIVENNVSSTITQSMRYGAFEIAPVYQITPNLNVGVYYLEGHAFQNTGPQVTRFLNFNGMVSNIKISDKIRFHLLPAIYYLYSDGYQGIYYTATGILTHSKSPFSISSSINQTIKTEIVGGKDFMWNVALNYNIRRTFKSIK
ncbi:MAG: hypothetical protein RLZZ628_3392 [Bacteroidota bacterium]|jgi:hypothetical protein